MQGVVRETSVAITLKARQESLERMVNLQVLRPELARDEQTAACFIAIAKATARLKHNNIAQVYDVVALEGQPPYAVSEHVDGPTVAELLKAEQTISPKKASQIASGGLEG